jgi:hypothetical protein
VHKENQRKSQENQTKTIGDARKTKGNKQQEIKRKSNKKTNNWTKLILFLDVCF